MLNFTVYVIPKLCGLKEIEKWNWENFPVMADISNMYKVCLCVLVNLVEAHLSQMFSPN